MDIKDMSLEAVIFQFIDQSKFLFFPEQWNSTFLDYSKNEAFTLFLVYRKGQVNMTEIADYLSVPLNTVTGIVSRLEKRDMIKRERDKDDKRIVVVNMTLSGTNFIKEQMKEMEYYFNQVMAELTSEELDITIKIIGKVFNILKSSNSSKDNNHITTKKVKRITIE